MLTTLLIGLLHAAPPAPDEGPPRIEGLRTTWVTPSTWVPALRPGRPFPEVTAGWDLVIHNPHLGGPSSLSIESLGLGEVNPDSTVVLHDVVPGTYTVTFLTPTGAERTRAIATTQRE